MGIYPALLFFIVFEMWCFVGNHIRFMVLLLSIMAGILCWILFQQKKVMSGLAFPVFAIFLLGQCFSFILFRPIDYYFFSVLFLFIPLVMAQYVQKARPKYMPGTGGIVLMVSGFIISFIYQTIVHRGNYEYSLVNDICLLLALFAFFITYALLALKLISLRQILMALSVSALPLLVYVLFASNAQGELSKLFTMRFGANSHRLSPNYIAQVLDFCFPFALFLAIGEKKIYGKIFFAFLSIIYCFCMFLTSSRGSIPGLIAIPLFFIFKSRSITIWVLVLVLTIGVFGTLGGRIADRILKPDRADNFSNMGRIEMLKVAHAILKENHYTFGIGMNNFRMEKYHYGFPLSFDKAGIMSSHNTFLEIWLGWGLLGLIGWISLLTGSLSHVLRTRLPVEMRYMKYALTFALLAFIVHSLFDASIALFTFLTLVFPTLSCMFFLTRMDVRNSAGTGIIHTNPDF